MRTDTASIVIVGANFSGLSAAAQLAGIPDVCLIDPHPWFEFLPNIHELISRHKKPAELRLDKRHLVTRMGHRLMQDRVLHINPKTNTLHTGQGKEIRYEACILTIGGVNNSGQVPGVAEHAFPFKSVAECAAIGDQLALLAGRGKPFSVVIVGAGVEGLEALGEILRAYRKAPVSIHLVERNTAFTLDASEKIGGEIQRICKDFPVSFHFGAGVSEVHKHAVALSTGEILVSDLTIWTGGVIVNPLLQEAGLVHTGDAWAAVNPQLQSTGFENIFLAGDSVAIAGAAEKQAYYALAMGEVAGKNAARLLKNRSLRPYTPQSFPSIYAFGDLSCFLTWKGQSLAGLPLASLKEGIYQYNMAQFQRPASFSEFAEAGFRSIKGAWGLGLSCLSTPLSLFQKPQVRLL